MRNLILRIKNSIIPYILFGIVTGIITGFLIYFYNFVLSYVSGWSKDIFAAVKNKPAFVPLLIAGVAALSLLLGLIIKLIPEISGGGIPYSEGVMRGKLTPRWYFALPGMFLASLMSIFMGFSLGGEGPSIFLGCMTGYGISGLLKSKLMDQRLTATAGACSGLAVAFNAPLAGIMFSVEEAHRKTGPHILIPAITSVITSTLTVNYIFGNKLFLHYSNLTMPVTVQNISGGLITGILCGFLAIIFNYLITKKVKLWDIIPLPFRILVPAVLCILFGFLLPQSTGTGKSLLLDISSFGTGMLALLFAAKYVFTIISNKSGASGGIFIPMLALGALIGALVSKMLTALNITNDLIFLSLMGAAAFFGASVRAPFTAAILIFEITGYALTPVIGIMVAVGAGYLVAELFKSSPLYENVLEGIINKHNINSENRTICEYSAVIEKNSAADGMFIKDLILPDTCLIVKVSRDNSVFVPDEETKLRENDSVIIACEKHTIIQAEQEFIRLFTDTLNTAAD